MSALPDYVQLTAAVSSNLIPLRKDIAPVMKAFGELGKAATTPTTLDEKTKEFVALGIAIATRCDACIGFHMRTLVRLGATKAEVEDVLGVAIYMGGGPAAMYAANAMAAWEQFSAACAPQA
jgi:AhpD family alkylhydroperoxidase